MRKKEIMLIRAPKTILLGVMFLLNFASGSVRSQAQTLPGTFTYSWVGNSFMDHNAKAWVPDEARDLCVDSNGTVFTAGYAEAGGSGLGIKNGAFFGRYSGFNSGFNFKKSVKALHGRA